MNQNEQQIFGNLTKCIEMTLSPNQQAIKRGEQQLESQHQKPKFGPILMKLLTRNEIPDNIKFGASIYFKNYIKKYWGKDEEIISLSDQEFIKSAIVRVMLAADKNVQRILSETISIIASHDFYTKWEALLPELIEKIKNEKNFLNICGVLKIIESITCRYPDKEKTVGMIEEIKYILNFFQDIWLSVLQNWSRPIINFFGQQTQSQTQPPKISADAIQQIKYEIFCVEQLILIFFDLNSVDLIAFFENNMSSWASIYKSLLICDDKFNVFNSSDDMAGPIDLLRTAVVRALKLFNNKYEEEYSKYVPIFVEQTCNLLTTINDEERYDGLAAESIAYLSSVACQQWNCQLFNNESILNNIVERILMRNIRLRESDLSMYETCGEDWILRDMEGSDLYTRRRGAIDLIRSLLEHFENDISTIIISKVQELMNKYTSNPSTNFIEKDTAINLILAVSIRGSTKLLGATKINTNVPVMQFFKTHIFPELTGKTKSHPLIISDCLKFVIIFRSQWPIDNFLQLLPMACNFLEKEDYVLHTYAAIAIDKILAMKTLTDNDQKKMKYKYPKQRLVAEIEKVLVALFTVLNTRQESGTNEYIMKCIMRVISRCEEGCISVIGPVINHISQILLKVSKNPQKPVFNHYMFECIAALIRFVCNSDSKNIEKFEGALMGPFKQILSQDQSGEFHPYIYQIIGLMLRIRNCVDQNYANLFDQLLETSLWNNDGNILAISGTFSDYLRLVNISSFINQRRLTGMLGIYQHLLSKRTQDYYAFLILRAIFQYIPHTILSKYLREIIELVCIRIKQKKSTALCCNFIVALSIFIIKNHGMTQLLTSCNAIQSNIFEMILEKIWLEYCRNVHTLIDRKILTIGMITMCNDSSFQKNSNLTKFIPAILNCIVEIFEAAPLQSTEQKNAEYYLQHLEDQGSGNKFVGLSFAKSPPHDITKNMDDPRKLLIQCVVGVVGGNPNGKTNFAKLSKPIICKTINQYAAKFNINFKLPILQQ